MVSSRSGSVVTPAVAVRESSSKFDPLDTRVGVPVTGTSLSRMVIVEEVLVSPTLPWLSRGVTVKYTVSPSEVRPAETAS